jgi:hypothetical protein
LSAALVLITALCVASAAAADLSYSTWYFGQGAGLRFTASGTTVLTNGRTNMIEGTSAISDPVTGALLFYTDGDNVWNSEHTCIATGIGGVTKSSTQAAMIVAAPNTPSLYFIITTQDATQGKTSEARVTAVRRSGDRFVVGDPQLLEAGVAEKIAVTSTKDGRGLWVLLRLRTPRRGFVAYRLDENGFGKPVYSTVGAALLQDNHGRGEMKISPDARWIATASENLCAELFTFDQTTGAVALHSTFGRMEQRYGVCFSNDASLLYMNNGWTHAPQNRIYQYDLNAKDIPASEQVVGTVEDGVGTGTMQMGPDGRIYVARYVTQHIGVIERPNLRGTACSYNDKAITFPLTVQVKWGLTVKPSETLVPNLTSADVAACIGTQTVIGQPAREGLTYRWEPATNLSDASAAQPTLTVASNQTLTLTVNDANGNRWSHSMNVIAHAVPQAKIAANGPITFCRGGSVVLDAGVDADSYTWSTGARTRTITVSSAGTYEVIVASAQECTTRDAITVNVADMPTAISTSDTAICKGESVTLLATGGVRYRWSPVTGLDDPESATPIATPLVSTQYTVEVFNAFGCSSVASVQVNVEQIPTLSIDQHDTTISACGSITLSAAEGFAAYRWNTGETTRSISVKAAGSYSVDAMTALGCTASSSPVTISTMSNSVSVGVEVSPSVARDGEHVVVRLVRTAGSDALSSSDSLSVLLRMRSGVLAPRSDAARGEISENIWRYVRVTVAANSDILAELPYVATLGDTIGTAIELIAVTPHGCLQADGISNATFSLDEVCYAGGRVRTVHAGTPTPIEARIMPNPAVGSTTVRFDLRTESSVDVEIIDVVGQRVLSADLGSMKAGTHEQLLDVSSLAAGTYLCSLMINGTPTTQLLEVRR